jgi:hypothetical protein
VKIKNPLRNFSEPSNNPVSALFGSLSLETLSLKEISSVAVSGIHSRASLAALVGYVPITSEVAQYRTTIQHTFSNWKTYSIVGLKNAYSPPGTPGFCFVPLEGNAVEYKPGKKRSSKQFNTVRLFYQNSLPTPVHYVLNDTTEFETDLHPSDTLQQLTLPQRNIGTVKFQFMPNDSVKLYGASFESGTGVFVDNFSMRGNSGMGLSQVSARFHREFNRFRDYKLILLQYGLNVVSETDSLGYHWYVDRMVRVVNALKENFPESSIVLLSVSDRSSNQDGKFATMPNIVLMRDAQREIAMQSHVAFWDLYTAMGGQNSMLKFVSATPPMAAKDYTHLTYWGGKKLAKKLADALLYERIRYEIKNKTQP